MFRTLAPNKKNLSWNKANYIYIFSGQTFIDMYTEIHVEISYFN